VNIEYQLYLSSTNTSWDISADNSIKFPSGSRVKCNLKFTGTQYIYTCTNLDTGEVKQVIKNSTLKIYQSPTQLGIKRGINPLKTNDSINLKQFKIYTDGNLVFDGGAETYVYDPSKFTIVGSPTITEYGVASGFSGSDYITTKNSIDFSNVDNWEIITPVFKHSTNLTVLSTVLCGGVAGNQDGIAIFMRPNGKTSWSVQDVQGGSFIFKRDANTTFTDGALNQFKMEFTGNAYNFYHSVNGGAFALVDTFASTTKTTVNTLLYLGVGIGQYYRGDYYALPSTSITVDNKEVFTGAKENYYMLNGI
jgi:hypothetical protein